jgi:hypothetical protein
MSASKISTAFQIKFAGRTVYCRIAPYCFFRPRSGFQMAMSLTLGAAPLGCVDVFDKDFDVTTMPLAKVVKKAKKIASDWINELDNRQKLVNTEKEWLDWLARCKEEDAKADKRELARLEAAKAKGFTHLLRAVVHRNGDDYMKSVLTVGKPSAALIKRIMSRSVVKDSYKVFAI